MEKTDDQLSDQPVPRPGPRVCLDEDAVCDVCGRFGACRVGDRVLCQECYAQGCSCCPEFGKDDLWTFEE